MPVRVVALTIVVPIRLAWELLAVAGRHIATVARFGYRCLDWLWQHSAVPLGRAVRRALRRVGRLLRATAALGRGPSDRW